LAIQDRAQNERQADVRGNVRRGGKEFDEEEPMLSEQDDFIGHQLPTTFDHVMSSDPAWMERFGYTGHPLPAGDFMFDIGLGWHPNRNVMDGFAGVAFNGKQYNFRVS
jgi:hypothetical protein